MHELVDLGTAVLVVAGIFVMVRPGSKGPSLVKNLTDGFASIVGSATGGGPFTPAK